MRNWKALVRARIEPLPLEAARAADIVDELAQHVAQHHADLVAAGMSDEEAVARVLAPLSHQQHVAREIALADRPRPSAPPPPAEAGHLFADLWRDVRYAARLLARAPGFTASAIVTLALGIGANTVIFGVVNSVLLRPLAYADPSRLVVVGERGADGSTGNVGYATFLDWKTRTHSFDDMALIRDWTATLVANGEPQRVTGIRVSANYFRLLGVRPALGRDFAAAEDDPNHWRVLMLSDGLWRRRFGADPNAVGRVVKISDRDYTIIGVMPPSFDDRIGARYYQNMDAWSLVGYEPSLPYACRSCQHLRAIGRLKQGVTADAAADDVNALHAQLRREHPADYDEKSTIAVEPLRKALTGSTPSALAMLMGAVAFVLLIACANVANLLLARQASRERDLALRAALGAGRWRIVRQLMTESGLLALAGGAVGALFSVAAMPAVVALAPASITRVADLRVDGLVFAFTGLITMATAVVFGLMPAIRASRINLRATIHSDSRTSSAAPGSLTRHVLVAAEVTLAVVLLAGAGLMIKSVARLLNENPGFSAEHVLTMRTTLLGRAYATNEQVLVKTAEMLQRLQQLPGVEAAAAASQIPLDGQGDSWGFHIQEHPSLNPANDPAVERFGVTPAYFDVMKIPLRRGRLFTDADRATTEPVLIVNERAARVLFGGTDPIGQHVRIGGDTGPWRTIVGVVGDVRHKQLAEPATTQMYTPQTQFTDSFLTIVVRTAGDPANLASEARRAIWSVASDVPVFQVAPLSALVAQSAGARRFVMVLLELFGAVALLMTAVGVYGVISYSVAERTREIGIRSALGASRIDIVRLVLGGGLGVVAVGLAAGVAVALAVTRYLEGSLYWRARHRPGHVRRCGAGAARGRGVRAGHAGDARDARRSVGGIAAGLVVGR